MSVEASQQKQQPDQQAIVGTVNKKKSYLLLSNPSKTTHIGTLLRCAAAFQVHQVLLVGYDKFNYRGSFGSHSFVDIVVFSTWESVHEYLRRGGDEDGDDEANDEDSKCDDANDNGEHIDQEEQQKSSTDEKPANEENKNPITIIGILGAYGGGEEIFSPDGMSVYEDLDKKYVSLVPPKDTANPGNAPCLPHCSHPISTRPFSTNVCFMLSKDKWGLPLSQARMCSGFVHVPHLTFDDDALPTLPLSLRPESNDSISTQASLPTTAPKPTTMISQSYLLDTASILSTVLHHFTAWACYTERTFEENQKFVKDIKPNERRRICRVFGQNYEKNENSKKPETNSEQEAAAAMDAMMLFKENGDASQGSDY